MSHVQKFKFKTMKNFYHFSSLLVANRVLKNPHVLGGKEVDLGQYDTDLKIVREDSRKVIEKTYFFNQ